ncbi:hypothetical protein FRB93_009067 [Tulasnella sp. JGI-2019a]|nr:hypothetical protein FRB93_009067 [Tulasnella sp. JGI-2019a]
MVAYCPSDNTQAVDQSSFWSNGGIHWDTHRIGWAIAGGCTILTTLLTLYNVQNHARNYRNPAEQRQIIRITYMPLVYGIISFFSYRYFRSYTYYELAEVVYEALTISAFLLLLIQYVARTGADDTAQAALSRKDKTKLPLPLCCWRYRPTKPYFMYTLKWSVLQYAAIRPLISIAGIVCQAFNVLCESTYSIHFAYVYLQAVDFVSISVALYGLILFYVLTKEELKGRRPLAKFMCIKLIVFFTFYQSFVFNILADHGVIKATSFWTSTNIVDGLNALATCIEMMFFAALIIWAYPASEYHEGIAEGKKRSAWKAIWDSINYSDFVFEIYTSCKFFWNYMRGKPETRSQKYVDERGEMDFERAFLQDRHGRKFHSSEDSTGGLVQRSGPGAGGPKQSMSRGASPQETDDGATMTSRVGNGYGNNNSYPMRPMDMEGGGWRSPATPGTGRR